MKSAESELVVSKDYAARLRARREAFRRATKTKKALFTTLVTTHGVQANPHRDAAVDAMVEAGAFFE